MGVDVFHLHPRRAAHYRKPGPAGLERAARRERSSARSDIARLSRSPSRCCRVAERGRCGRSAQAGSFLTALLLTNVFVPDLGMLVNIFPKQLNAFHIVEIDDFDPI